MSIWGELDSQSDRDLSPSPTATPCPASALVQDLQDQLHALNLEIQRLTQPSAPQDRHDLQDHDDEDSRHSMLRVSSSTKSCPRTPNRSFVQKLTFTTPNAALKAPAHQARQDIDLQDRELADVLQNQDVFAFDDDLDVDENSVLNDSFIDKLHSASKQYANLIPSSGNTVPESSLLLKQLVHKELLSKLIKQKLQGFTQKIDMTNAYGDFLYRSLCMLAETEDEDFWPLVEQDNVEEELADMRKQHSIVLLLAKTLHTKRKSTDKGVSNLPRLIRNKLWFRKDLLEACKRMKQVQNE